MEKGKLYKSIIGKMVVFCITILDDKLFEGVVIDSGNTSCDIGYTSNGFVQNSFKEYAPIKTLAEGQIYDVPKGYKATIKNGQVLIEGNTKYIKHEFEGFVSYGKHIEDGRTTLITLGYNGDTEISHIGERPCPDISGCVKEIDEIEFTNAYNTALKNLEL